MKGYLKGIAILLMIAMLCVAGFAVAEGLQMDVVVLFTSDVHCGMDEGFTYVGLKAIRDAMEETGNYVLLVDNGDSIQGASIGMMTKGEGLRPHL